MKKVQFLMALLLGTVAAAHSARGQTSVQRLSFSVFGQYQTNELTTHSSRTATNRITTEVAKSVEISSANIVKALDWAKKNGLETIALVGGKRGPLAEIADHVIVIDSVHYGRVEDAQMAVCHMLCYAFMENPRWGE